jgi:hypothetical protein
MVWQTYDPITKTFPDECDPEWEVDQIDVSDSIKGKPWARQDMMDL